MNIRQFVCVTVGLFLFAAASRYVATAGQELEDKKESLLSQGRAGSPRDLAVRIGTLLSSSPTSELNHLVTAPDCTVALAAGWERVCRTLPEKEQDELVSPDDEAVFRFLGLLEGRIQFPIPEAWEAAVKSGKAYSQREFRFSRPNRGKQPFPEHGLLRRTGRQWIVEKDRQLIKLPADDGLGPVDYAAVEFAGERAYTALYSWPPAPYRLFATDRGSGQILWSSSVWAAGNWLAYSGSGWHFVTMRSAGDKLAVFGISSRTVYAEVFDKKTGENRCRFSTAYFDAASPRK